MELDGEIGRLDLGDGSLLVLRSGVPEVEAP
jgi:hypothetical protein